jgi:tRNA nucleotidyltransferase/poly(A) polymerase
MEKAIKIPSKKNPKWKELLNGKLDITLNNFFLQKKVNQLIDLSSREIITINNAIDELYTLCGKFCNAQGMYEDLIQIFGKDNIIVKEIENIEAATIIIKKKAITKLELKEILVSKDEEIEKSKALIEKLQEENVLLIKKYESLKKGLDTLKNLNPKKEKKVKTFMFF